MLYTVQVFFNLHFLYESIQILFYFYCTGQTFLTFLIIFWIGKFKFRRRNFFSTTRWFEYYIQFMNPEKLKMWEKEFLCRKIGKWCRIFMNVWIWILLYCNESHISRGKANSYFVVFFFSFPYICKIECKMCILYDMFYDLDIEKYWEIPRFFFIFLCTKTYFLIRSLFVCMYLYSIWLFGQIFREQMNWMGWKNSLMTVTRLNLTGNLQKKTCREKRVNGEKRL